MKKDGMTLIIDFRPFNMGLLEDEFYIANWCRQIIKEIGLTHAGLSMSARFPSIVNPNIEGGISVILLLGESHFAYHSYPEDRYAHIVIDSCRKFNDMIVENIVKVSCLEKGFSKQITWHKR